MHVPAPPRRVLWVSAEPPDRTRRGGSIRQAYLFEALARAFSVDLLLAGELEDERVRAAAHTVTEFPSRPAVMPSDAVLRRAVELAITLGSPYPLPAYMEGPARRRLRRALNARHTGYELVCIEHEALAPLIRPSSPTRWIVTFHHLLSGMIGAEVALAPGRRQRWFRERDVLKARRMEAAAVRSSDRCIVCSEEDAVALRSIGAGFEPDRIGVVPNGVDLSAFRAVPLPSDPVVLFPGTFCYSPNIDGAQWLCEEVWPRIRAAVPNAKLVLAGRAPVQDVLRLGERPGVTVHPDVPSMVPYFESARVVVVPLRIGTGTRIKALEAMAAGRPVVGTVIGVEGIGAVDGANARVADDAAGFAAAVIQMLQETDAARAIGEAGRTHVQNRYGWDRIGGQFVTLVSDLLEREDKSARAAVVQ